MPFDSNEIRTELEKHTAKIKTMTDRVDAETSFEAHNIGLGWLERPGPVEDLVFQGLNGRGFTYTRDKGTLFISVGVADEHSAYVIGTYLGLDAMDDAFVKTALEHYGMDTQKDTNHIDINPKGFWVSTVSSFVSELCFDITACRTPLTSAQRRILCSLYYGRQVVISTIEFVKRNDEVVGFKTLGLSEGVVSDDNRIKVLSPFLPQENESNPK